MDSNRVFGGGFRKSWEGFEVWSEVDSKVAGMDSGVDALHDGRKVDFVVIVFIWSFRNRKGS